MNRTPLVLAVLALCAAAVTTEVQVGARFPLGVQIGNGGNCTQLSDYGYLRFNEQSQKVEVCRQTGWTEIGTEQTAEINADFGELQDRVTALEGEVFPPLSLSQSNALLQKLVDAEYCNKRGVYDADTDLCACRRTPQHGYWDDESFCTTCYAGYTGATCKDDVNECSSGSHSCGTLHNCVNTVGSYDCECTDGYQGDSSSCTDINECTEGTHTCDANAVCTNTQGSFTCECNEGYYGDGFECTDIPPMEFLVSHGGWDFFKVPTTGPMSAANVRATCLGAGLVNPCPGDSSCSHSDTSQCTVTSEVGCGNPMYTTSQVMCGTNVRPHNCPALNYVYIYMKNWSNLSACGAYDGSWCDAGSSRSDLNAFCARPS